MFRSFRALFYFFSNKKRLRLIPQGCPPEIPPGNAYGRCPLNYHKSKYPGYAFTLVTRKPAHIFALIGSFTIFASSFLVWRKGLDQDLEPTDETFNALESGTPGVFPFIISLILILISILAFRNPAKLREAEVFLLPKAKIIYVISGILISSLLTSFFFTVGESYIVVKIIAVFFPQFASLIAIMISLSIVGPGFFLAYFGFIWIFTAGIIPRKKIYFSIEQLQVAQSQN